MRTTIDQTAARWTSAWPDALAFVLGLGVSRIAGWTTTDLVWSLWLSSLVVGYATIVWTIIRPGVDIVRGARRDRALTAQMIGEDPKAAFVAVSILIGIGLFGLAFFTLHFGGFHYGHSRFLIAFFPLDGGPIGVRGVDISTYVEVARRYWHFLPSAFLAERAGFLRPPARTRDDLSVTSAAIAARNAANAAHSSGAFTAPYRNVMRMHLLIFFFVFAHFAKLDGFAVYATVYAIYFFPWRLLRSGQGVQGGPSVQSVP